MAKHPETLISVRNAWEAAMAARFPIGILDLKDPQKGSLGAVSRSDREEILRVNSNQFDLSLALGELVDLPAIDSSAPMAWEWLNGFRYAKVGLAGAERKLQDWRASWSRLSLAISRTTVLVGVAYADWSTCHAPSIDEVFEMVRRGSALSGSDSWSTDQGQIGRQRVMLLDTYSKSGESIVDILGWHGIESWVETARSDDVNLVVAGSVRRHHLERLIALAPDCIGFRGAVCEQGRDRLSEEKLEEIFFELDRVNGLRLTSGIE